MKLLNMVYIEKYPYSSLVLHFKLHQFLTKVMQRLLSIPSDVALWGTSNRAIEQLWLQPRYELALRQHQPTLPELPDHHLNIIADLDREGVSVTTLDALNVPDSAQFFAAAKALAAELDAQTKSPPYVGKHTLTATAEQLLRYPEIFLWGANQQLLSIVERYLQLPVAYDGLSYYFSVADGKEEGPRKWHRDKEDRRMIKVCIYLNDVDEWGGPYECVQPEINLKLRQLLPEYKVLSHAQMTQLLEKHTPNWFKSYWGAAGTVIFTDTAQYYHRGKPPVQQNRAAVFFSYFSRYPKNPFFCGRSPLSQQQLSDLSANLTQDARDAILWKRSQPLPIRLIPKNRLKV